MITEDAKTHMKPFLVLMIIGVLIFIVGVAISINYIFIYPKNKGKVEAVITDISHDTTTVNYEVNGRIYKKVYSVYSSNYYVGKKVNVLYNKAHPQKSMISSFRYLSLIGPGIGIVFLGVSGIGLLFIYQKYYRI